MKHDFDEKVVRFAMISVVGSFCLAFVALMVKFILWLFL